MEQAVTEAVRILREGGVILYPTDTVWGIGCDATNAEAVERIYHLKRSENKKSMLVLCATPDMVVRYVHVGSEMCIRDRPPASPSKCRSWPPSHSR